MEHDSQSSPLTAIIPTKEHLVCELRYAAASLSAHRLHESSKWASELLKTLITKEETSHDQDLTMESMLAPSIDQMVSDISEYPKGQESFDYVYFEMPSKANDALNLARSLFDLKEYKKAAHVLKKYANPQNQSALFLYSYSNYLVSEQMTEEERFQNGENASRSLVINRELVSIEQSLEGYYQRDELDAYNLYVYGVTLKQREKHSKAQEVLIQALNRFPLLWSAWNELNLILSKDQKVLPDSLDEHWAKNFYLSSFLIKVQKEDDSIPINTRLLETFKSSVYLINEIAHACYSNQSFDQALDMFKKLKQIDPFRYETMDLYSNILYIKEDFGELAHLAYETFTNDKYRPQTCCVLGNYYSLRGDHEKAITYFKRAIKLDSDFLSAWTLMGHEYLELKNTSAAIESYRSAIDKYPNDFRAWYGLGQAYEIHQMYNYASHYYGNAALSRPQDSRMWSAMGNCYEKMRKSRDAQKCFERAEELKDSQGIALLKLGRLYLSMNEPEKAAACYEENLLKANEETCEESELTECHQFLAKYYVMTDARDKAIEHLTKLTELGGMEREKAKEELARLQE